GRERPSRWKVRLARDRALAVAAVAHGDAPVIERLLVLRGRLDRVALERIVARGALEEVGEPGPAQVRSAERVLREQGRSQPLSHPHARDPDLAQATGAPGAMPRLSHLLDLDPQRAHP